MKGMIVRVYCTQQLAHHRCVPSQHLESVLLIGEDVPETFETQREHPVFLPVFKLVKRTLFGQEHLHVEPAEQAPKGNYAFGGNYVFSSEAGFPSRYLVPIHDQWIPNNYPCPD